MKTGIPSGRFAAIVPLLVLVSLTGCKTWQAVETSPAPWIAQERPREVRLTTEDGARMTLRSPIVANDSIVSSVEGPPVLPRRGVALADLRALEVSRFSADQIGRTRRPAFWPPRSPGPRPPVRAREGWKTRNRHRPSFGRAFGFTWRIFP